MTKRYLALTALLCLLNTVQARQEKASCGTHAEKALEEVQLHRIAGQRGIRKVRRANAALVAGEHEAGGFTVRPDQGNIAILDDTDGVVSRRNPFNLNKKTLRFLPLDKVASKYRYEVADESYDTAAASAGSLLDGLDDDDTREVALPFPFPFYGQSYSSVFVNSDGNASFISGDKAITDRSLGRMTAGVPRLAPLFEDLDPTRARTGVTVQSTATQFVVSWVQVPEYRDSGTGPLQTFQMRLYPDGRIEYAYDSVSSLEAVVGISRGRLAGQAAVVSFLTTPSAEYTSTITERFAGSESVDIFATAQKFYASHDDAYDYLVIFNNLGIGADTGAVAFEVTVRNARDGYGDPHVNTGADTGSKRRLQALMNMGNLSQYPADPAAKVPARLTTGDTPVTVLAHETGHLFLAYASVKDASGNRPMLGWQNAHWALTFNSEASLLEGHRIQDNGPNANPRFLTTATVEGYAPLDQYLMGLRAPEEVPPTFYVANPGPGVPTGLPRVGASFNGDRKDVNISDIINTMGRRVPDYTAAQRRFRFAFILVTASGTEPSAADLAQVESYRTAFESFYSKATSNRAVADTSIRRAVQLSVAPAAGVASGSTATGTISLDSPAETPLTVMLRSEEGNVQVPASVTIPAGSTSATFNFTGARIGTGTLIAEPADSRFETVWARMAVTDTASQRIAIISGDGQAARAGVLLNEPIQVRVTDANNLPYPSARVVATVTGGGSVQSATATTDADGMASFRWTPGAGSVNELRITGTGANAPAVTVTALTRPSISTGGIVNAASFASGIVPGGIATIFGSNLGSTAGTEVLVNGRSAQVFYSSSSQVNFLVPNSVSGTADIAIRNTGGSSDMFHATVSSVQPGIFFDAATGYGAVLISGTASVTQVRPAQRGEIIEIYTTGLGSVGAGNVTTSQPTVEIGGAPAEVLYSGLAPGFPGLYQVNARIPAASGTGTQTLVLTSGGTRSNQVNIEVR